MNDCKDNPAISFADMESDIPNAAVDKKETQRFDSLVNIRVISYRRRKHDPDGVSVKAVLDGIVRRGILANDSTSEINEITFKSIIIKKGEQEKTIVEISDELD